MHFLLATDKLKTDSKLCFDCSFSLCGAVEVARGRRETHRDGVSAFSSAERMQGFSSKRSNSEGEASKAVYSPALHRDADFLERR